MNSQSDVQIILNCKHEENKCNGNNSTKENIKKNNKHEKGTYKNEHEKGFFYQVILYVFVLQRILNRNKKFLSKEERENIYIGKEISEVGKFDDLVMLDGKTFLFLQAKTVDNGTIKAQNLLTGSHLSENNKFSLLKYFFAHLKFKGEYNLKNKQIINILYTNIDLHSDDFKIGNNGNEDEHENIKKYIDLINSKKESSMQYSVNVESIFSEFEPKTKVYNLNKLAYQLSTCILYGNFIDHNDKEKMFYSYHLVLAKEVFDIGGRLFKKDFINDHDIQDVTKEFRKVFEEEIKKQYKNYFKWNEENEKNIELTNLNKIIDMNKSQEQIVQLNIDLNFSKNFGTKQVNNNENISENGNVMWPRNTIEDDETVNENVKEESSMQHSKIEPKTKVYNRNKLAEQLVECILFGKIINHKDKDKIFSSYHLILAEEVFDVENELFKEEFITGHVIQNTKKFRKDFEEELKKQYKNYLKLNNGNTAENNIELIKLHNTVKKIKSENKNQKQNKKLNINLKFSENFGTNKGNNNENSSENVFWPKNTIPNDKNKDDIKEFFKTFILATNQPSFTEFVEIIIAELKSSYHLDSSENSKSLYIEIFAEIFKWFYSNEDKWFTSDRAQTFIDNKISKVSFEIEKPIDCFIGREKELKTLEKHVMGQNITIITGLGGIGKSQLANKFVSSPEISKKIHNKIRISAENKDEFEKKFKELAKDNNIPIESNEISVIVEKVYNFFTFSNQQSLFIFDNVKDSETLENFLRPNIPHIIKIPTILITSRYRKWGDETVIEESQEDDENGLYYIDLDVLDEDESKDLIKKNLNIQDNCQDDKINMLYDNLNGLPLALIQAIGDIMLEKSQLDTNANTSYSIEKYVNEYKNKEINCLQSEIFKNQFTHYSKTTYETWKETFNDIKKKLKKDKIKKNLYGMILDEISNQDSKGKKISSNDIIETMRQEYNGLNEGDVTKILNLLHDYSIIKIKQEEEEGFIYIHKLVQIVYPELKNPPKKKDRTDVALLGFRPSAQKQK